MRLFLGSISLVLLAVSQGAAADDFYPLPVGRLWTYQVGEKDKFVMTVTGTTKVGAQDCLYLEATLNGKVTGNEQVAMLNDGLYRFMAGETRYDPPICFFKPTAKKGDSWKQDYKFGDIKGTITFTVDVQDVTVPAGKFVGALAVRAESAETTPKTDKNPGKESVSKATIYYAKGYGIVKQVFVDGDKEVVLSLEKIQQITK